MKRTIARKYELTNADLKAAVMCWLKERDVPVPDCWDDAELTVAGAGEWAKVEWTDTVND